MTLRRKANDHEIELSSAYNGYNALLHFEVEKSVSMLATF